MEAFLKAIPAAASSPYAFAAYVIAALVFMFAGAKLMMARFLLAKIASLPESDRRRAVEIATNTILPKDITPEQWIRHSRQQYIFLLLGSLLISAMAVAMVALIGPNKKGLDDIRKTTQETVEKGTKVTSDKIDRSTEKIVATVEDVALANLETMFPLTVRIDHEVDGTLLHINGIHRQLITSYDKNYDPLVLY